MKIKLISILFFFLLISSCQGDKFGYHDLIQITDIPKSVSIYSYQAEKESNGVWTKGAISENFPIIQYVFNDNGDLENVKHYNHLKELVMYGKCIVKDGILIIEFVDKISDQVISIEEYKFNSKYTSELNVYESDRRSIIRRVDYKWNGKFLESEEHKLFQAGEYSNSYVIDYFYENGKISREKTVFSYANKPDEIFNNNYLNIEYDNSGNWTKRINPNSYNENIGSYEERVFKY